MRKQDDNYKPPFCVGDGCNGVEEFVDSMEWESGKTYPAFELWLMYADYCREQGMLPSTQYAFSRCLVELGYEKIRKYNGMAFRMVKGGCENDKCRDV